MSTSTWKWLAGKMAQDARPHHNFHVFDIYTRAGLMNNDKADIALSTMDSCRISWGRVVDVEADHLVVERQPLVLCNGRLALGAAVPLRVTRQLDGRALGGGDGSIGADVSVHWNWACNMLPGPALVRLRANTAKYLDLANQTL